MFGIKRCAVVELVTSILTILSGFDIILPIFEFFITTNSLTHFGRTCIVTNVDLELSIPQSWATTVRI